MYYILRKYNKKGSYDILKDMSENVTLVQVIHSLGNFNHAISVLGYWIFDSKYENALVLNRESLDMICARLLVKNKSLCLKQYLLQRDTFSQERTKKGVVVIYQFNN